MRASIRHVDKLLELLSDKTRQALDVKGLKEMSELLGLQDKYLYEYVYRKKEKAKQADEAEISIQSSKLEVMAKFVGYRSYAAFINDLEPPLDPVLKGVIGNYYSYVRRNDDKGYLLRSPVRIVQHGHQVMVELFGPKWVYRGVMKKVHGCLFVLLEADGGGKMIHHVYKIGNREEPGILQGVFSGVSTSFDPIGGRTVLVRVKEPFDALVGREGLITEFEVSDLKHERKVAAYLEEYSRNNLRINRVITFELDDLIE